MEFTSHEVPNWHEPQSSTTERMRNTMQDIEHVPRDLDAKVRELKAQYEMQQLQQQLQLQQDQYQTSDVSPSELLDPHLEKLKSELRSAEREATSRQGNFVALQQVQHKTQQEWSSATKTIDELRRELATAKEDSRRARVLLEAMKATPCGDCSRWTLRVSQLETEVGDAKHQQRTASDTAAALQKELESLQVDRRTNANELSAHANASRVELHALQLELQTVKADHDATRKERSELQTRYQEMERRHAQFVAGATKEKEASSSFHDDELTRTRAELAELHRSMTQLKAQLKKETSDTKVLRKQLEQAQASDANNQKQIEVLSYATDQQLQLLMTEQKAIETHTRRLETELDELRKRTQAEIPVRDQQLQTLAVEKQVVEKELHELRKRTLVTSQQTSVAKQAFEKETHRLELELETVQNRTQTELSAKDEQLQTLALEMRAVVEANRVLESDAKTFQKQKLADRDQQICTLTAERQAVEKESRRLETELDEVRKHAQAEMLSQTQQLQTLGAEKLTIEKEMRRLEMQLEELRVETPAKDQQLQTLTTEKQAVEKEKRRLEIENERLESERRHLKSEISLLMDERLLAENTSGDRAAATATAARQSLETEELEASLRENNKLTRRIEQLQDELRGILHAKHNQEERGIGRIRDTDRASSPSDFNTDWKSQLAKPVSVVATPEKATAVRYGGRNVLVRGGDNITYAAK